MRADNYGQDHTLEGIRFRVNDGSFFTASRNININDVITTPGAEADGLICQSELSTVTLGSGNWYLHPEDQTTAESDRIQNGGDRGWRRTRTTTNNNFRQVILRRQPAPETALEGRFTCKITGDNNPMRSLYVLYPSKLSPQPINAYSMSCCFHPSVSSVTASIMVISARDGEFRVQCRSTGGRALSMTVTGPDGYNSNITSSIQPVGATDRTGSDEYSATTSDIITGGSDGDEYVCTATGSTSDTGSVQLRGEDHTLSVYTCESNSFISHQLLVLQSLSHWREQHLAH